MVGLHARVCMLERLAVLRVPGPLSRPIAHADLLVDTGKHAKDGEQAKRVMQRFYAEHNEQTRRLFDELAPGAAEGVSWLRGATASTAPKSRERSRHRHL